MRVIVNFMYRNGWFVHCLADDARTPISPYITVATLETLIRLLRYVGAGEIEIAEVHEDVRRWSRGSVYVDLAPGRKNLLGIRPPWNDRVFGKSGRTSGLTAIGDMARMTNFRPQLSQRRLNLFSARRQSASDTV